MFFHNSKSFTCLPCVLTNIRGDAKETSDGALVQCVCVCGLALDLGFLLPSVVENTLSHL